MIPATQPLTPYVLRKLERRTTYRHETEMVRVVAALVKGLPAIEVFAHSALGSAAQAEAIAQAKALLLLKL